MDKDKISNQLYAAPQLKIAGKSIHGIIKSQNFDDSIRNDTKDIQDQLLNDYLAVNPKQVDTPKKK